MSRQRRQRANALHDENYKRAFDLIGAMPPEAAVLFAKVAGELADCGTRLQLPPEQMLSGLATIAAAMLLCNLDPRDEPAVNRVLWFAQDAIHIAVALRRLEVGAIGERPDGSFGIRADA